MRRSILVTSIFLVIIISFSIAFHKRTELMTSDTQQTAASKKTKPVTDNITPAVPAACATDCHQVLKKAERIPAVKREDRNSGILHSSPQLVGSWFKTRSDSASEG